MYSVSLKIIFETSFSANKKGQHVKYTVHREKKESFFNLNVKIENSNKTEGDFALP